MTGGKYSQGYTIVEVLIFMAVSGLMFVLAVVFVNGKQAQVEFRQGLFLVNSDIRSTINQVSNGRTDTVSYTNSRRCNVPLPTNATSRPTFSAAVTTPKGSNGGSSGCVFLGKVMQFNVTGQADSDTFYNVFTVAGRQTNFKDNPVVSFSEAMPVPMVTAYGADDITAQKKLQSGLRVTGSFLCQNAACSASQPIGQVGFYGSFNTSQGTADTSGRLQSGAQSVTTAVVPSSVGKFGMTKAEAEQDIFSSAFLTDPAVHRIGSNRYVLLCFSNGIKRGSVSIGGINGQEFTTEVKTNNLATVCPA